MKAAEFDDRFGYYDPNEDDLSRAKISDTRKKHFTLRELNKLKKIQASRRLEKLQRYDVLEIIYGQGDEGGGGGGLNF